MSNIYEKYNDTCGQISNQKAMYEQIAISGVLKYHEIDLNCLDDVKGEIHVFKVKELQGIKEITKIYRKDMLLGVLKYNYQTFMLEAEVYKGNPPNSVEYIAVRYIGDY